MELISNKNSFEIELKRVLQSNNIIGNLYDCLYNGYLEVYDNNSEHAIRTLGWLDEVLNSEYSIEILEPDLDGNYTYKVGDELFEGIKGPLQINFLGKKKILFPIDKIDDDLFIYDFLHELTHAYSSVKNTESFVPQIFIKKIHDFDALEDRASEYMAKQLELRASEQYFVKSSNIDKKEKLYILAQQMLLDDINLLSFGLIDEHSIHNVWHCVAAESLGKKTGESIIFGEIIANYVSVMAYPQALREKRIEEIKNLLGKDAINLLDELIKLDLNKEAFDNHDSLNDTYLIRIKRIEGLIERNIVLQPNIVSLLATPNEHVAQIKEQIRKKTS